MKEKTQNIEHFSLIEQYPHIHLCLNEDGSYAKIACDHVIKNCTECIMVDKKLRFVYTTNALSLTHMYIYMTVHFSVMIFPLFINLIQDFRHWLRLI